MSHMMIIGINRCEKGTVSDLTEVLAGARQTDVRESLFQGKGFVAMVSGESQGNALFTCQEGIFTTSGFLDVLPGALANEEVAARYAEDCMKAFLKQHGIRAKIESDRSERNILEGDADILFVAIDLEVLDAVPTEKVHQALMDCADGYDPSIKGSECRDGVWIDHVMHLTRPMIGLHAITSEVETIQAWEENSPLYGHSIKILDMSNVSREYLQLSYVLSAIGRRVVASKEQGNVDGISLVMNEQKEHQVA